MTQTVCPQCGHSFSPAASPGGMCPRCLLFGGAEPPPDDLSLEDLRDAVPGFRVEAQLGRGGMGAVFRARQLDLDRDVAIKFIAPRENDPSFGERFEREARTMARLAHPNIVAVHSYGRAGGFAYIIMEYVEGGDLAQLIAAGRIPEAVALGVVEQVCGALAYAHEQGCVHRDIKPGNILLDTQGRVKVADFGLVKVLGENAAASALTLSFAGVGTPLYAAPEQTKPGAPVDHRADIYALGVMLYEMLTGEVPRGIFQKPSAKSGTLVRWDRIIVRAMDAQPARRWASTAEIGRELVVIRRELAPGFVPWRRRWKKWALAGAGVAAVAALAFALLRPADFTIVRTGSEIVFTDKSGRSGVLAVSEPEPGRIQFSAADRTFRIGWGSRTAGGTTSIPLAGITRITVEGKGSARTLSIGAFKKPLPSLALRGGAATFEGDIAFERDASFEFAGVSAEIAVSAHLITSGAGSITFTTSGPIQVNKGAGIETENGGIALSANATGATVGAFTGIDIAGGSLTTGGTGKIALAGRSGALSAANNLYGIYMHRGAVVRSSRDAASAGTIAVTGFGSDADGGSNRGVGISGERTQISSVSGAVTISGTAGTGGDGNLTGIDIRDGGKVVSTGKGAASATITMRGAGSVLSSGDYNCGILVGTTDARGVPGAGVFSVDGAIALTGIGGAGGVLCNGIFIGDGTAVAATGTGSVAIIGTSVARTIRSSTGVQIFGNHHQGPGTRVSSADGDLTIEGTALNPVSTAITIEDPASVSASGSGRITLIGDSMKTHGAVDAGANDVALRPRTVGTRINLGSILGPNAGTLELSNEELSRITASTLHIGDVRSGPITTSALITPPTSVVLTTGGTMKFDTSVNMKPHNSLYVTALNVHVTLPGAGLTATGTGAISVTAKREFFSLHATSITTQDGNLTVSANADASELGDFHGVEILGGRIQTTGSGALSLTGIRGGGGDAVRFGMNIQDGGSISGGTGGTSVIADGNGTRYALVIGSASNASTTSSGPLLLRADSIEIGPGATVSSGTATTTIAPRTVGTLIHLGGADVLNDTSPSLGLTDAELSRITAGEVKWGDERSGPITVSEPISPANRSKIPGSLK